jgi:hypothetical protein
VSFAQALKSAIVASALQVATVLKSQVLPEVSGGEELHCVTACEHADCRDASGVEGSDARMNDAVKTPANLQAFAFEMFATA